MSTYLENLLSTLQGPPDSMFQPQNRGYPDDFHERYRNLVEVLPGPVVTGPVPVPADSSHIPAYTRAVVDARDPVRHVPDGTYVAPSAYTYEKYIAPRERQFYSDGYDPGPMAEPLKRGSYEQSIKDDATRVLTRSAFDGDDVSTNRLPHGYTHDRSKASKKK